MAAIIDSRESGKVLVAAERQSIAGRASVITALTASCLLIAPARAGDFTAPEKKSGGTDSSLPEDADAFPDTGLDSTVLHSRVALTNEFKDQEFGAAKDTVTLNLAHVFGNAARPDWTAQVDLPVVHYDAGRIRGVESGTGFGDLEIRVGHVIHAEGIFRYAAGLEAEFDTAGGPPRGDGIFRLSPIVAFAVQPCPTFKFQTFVQFNQSFFTETGVSEEQELHLKPALSIALPDNWYAYTEFEETWAFPTHGEFSSTAKFEIGRSFGARSEWVLSARCELPIARSSDDYTVTVGCTYVFK
jgi:hypothetical protein